LCCTTEIERLLFHIFLLCDTKFGFRVNRRLKICKKFEQKPIEIRVLLQKKSNKNQSKFGLRCKKFRTKTNRNSGVCAKNFEQKSTEIRVSLQKIRTKINAPGFSFFAIFAFMEVRARYVQMYVCSGEQEIFKCHEEKSLTFKSSTFIKNVFQSFIHNKIVRKCTPIVLQLGIEYIGIEQIS
jgi:hypothetical protein